MPLLIYRIRRPITSALFTHALSDTMPRREHGMAVSWANSGGRNRLSLLVALPVLLLDFPPELDLLFNTLPFELLVDPLTRFVFHLDTIESLSFHQRSSPRGCGCRFPHNPSVCSLHYKAESSGSGRCA